MESPCGEDIHKGCFSSILQPYQGQLHLLLEEQAAHKPRKLWTKSRMTLLNATAPETTPSQPIHETLPQASHDLSFSQQQLAVPLPQQIRYAQINRCADYDSDVVTLFADRGTLSSVDARRLRCRQCVMQRVDLAGAWSISVLLSLVNMPIWSNLVCMGLRPDTHYASYTSYNVKHGGFAQDISQCCNSINQTWSIPKHIILR